jgi:hypothetical protein
MARGLAASSASPAASGTTGTVALANDASGTAAAYSHMTRIATAS